MYCPVCSCDISEFEDMEYLMEVVHCSVCGTELEVFYDESYDEETGEEDGGFWVERRG